MPTARPSTAPGRARVLASVAIMTFVVASCGSSAPVATNQVSMDNFEFLPDVVTVPVGTTVTWTNRATTEIHNVTAAGGGFTSANFGSTGTFSHTFGAPGTYPYTCTLHSGMNGTVIVAP